MADIYTRVSELEAKALILEAKHNDSGWIDLPLSSGVLAYSEAQKPQYRKIGNTVHLRGVYIGGSVQGTQIAQLPEGFRPSQRIMKYVPAYGHALERLEVETDGRIIVAETNINDTANNKFHSISDYSFLID